MSQDDGTLTNDYCHWTKAAYASRDLATGGRACSTCASYIEEHDDAGFTFVLCPQCDARLRRDLVKEREFMIREAKRSGQLR